MAVEDPLWISPEPPPPSNPCFLELFWHSCQLQKTCALQLQLLLSYSREVWNEVKSKLGLATDTRSPNWEWWSIMKTCRGKEIKSEIIKVFVCAAVNSIWVERNRRIHQNKRTTAAGIKANLMKDMVIYLQVQLEEVKETNEVKDLLDRIGVSPKYRPRNSISCSWQSPEVGTILINSDGAVSNTRTGYGGILRNAQGDALLAYNGGSTSSSVLKQELDAIWFGLKGAEMLNEGRVEVATDSLRAKNILTGKEIAPWYCRDQVQGLKLLTNKFGYFSIRHTYRESNQAADYIAGLGGMKHDPTVFFTGPFDAHLSEILDRDKSGVLYLRLY